MSGLEEGVRLGAQSESVGVKRLGPPGRASNWQRLFDGAGWRLLLLGADALLLTLASVAARAAAPASAIPAEGAGVVWLLPPVVIALFAATGMYKGRLQRRRLDEAARVIAATSLGAMLLIAAAALVDPAASPAELLARAWLFATAYVVACRLMLLQAQGRARAHGLVAQPTLIVGTGSVGATIERRLLSEPEMGLRPVGFVDFDDAPSTPASRRNSPLLGPPTELGRIAEETGARHVVLAFVAEPDTVLIPLIRECERRRIEISLVPRLFESLSERITLEHIGGLPLVGLRSVNPRSWQFALKHLFDRAGAALMLLLLSPLMLAAALAVKLSSPGPVLFKQRRVGRDGHAFNMLKFRSMRLAAKDEDAVEHREPELAPGGIEGDDRRTPVGRLLRYLSFDELPQLINVLKGDMSIVGPRPERPEFVAVFDEQIRSYGDRHRVKSGVTGWAQVHGLRGRTSLADRVEWDNYYIQNWSLWLDFKILLMTVFAIFHSDERK